MSQLRSTINLGFLESGLSFDRRGFMADFTSRDLSVQTDKLIAFEGFATVISERTGHQFHARIWRGAFARALFWYADPRKPPPIKPSVVRAPSGSWAAWDGSMCGLAPAYKHNDSGFVRPAEDGNLINPQFVPRNFTMSAKGPIKPLSMELEGFLFAATRADHRRLLNRQTLATLRGVVDLWPWPDTEPSNEPPMEKLDLLYYIDPQKRYTGSSGTCPSCKNELELDDQSWIAHVEQCTTPDGSGQTTSDPRPGNLCGVAYLDDPDNHRDTLFDIECLVLWGTTVGCTIWRNEPPKTDVRGSYGMRVIHPDQSNALAMQYAWAHGED